MTAETVNGVFTFEVVPYGSWQLREISAPEGFIVDESSYPIAINENGRDFVFNVTPNRYMTGKITVIKTGGGTALRGAKFGLFRENETDFSESAAVMTGISGTDGLTVFENVRYGRYVIRELEAPEGYLLNTSVFSAAVDSDGKEISLTVADTQITGTARTTKTDRDYPENRLSGAVFEIFRDTNGNGAYDAGTDILVFFPAVTEKATGYLPRRFF